MLLVWLLELCQNLMWQQDLAIITGCHLQMNTARVLMMSLGGDQLAYHHQSWSAVRGLPSWGGEDGKGG